MLSVLFPDSSAYLLFSLKFSLQPIALFLLQLAILSLFLPFSTPSLSFGSSPKLYLFLKPLKPYRAPTLTSPSTEVTSPVPLGKKLQGSHLVFIGATETWAIGFESYPLSTKPHLL